MQRMIETKIMYFLALEGKKSALYLRERHGEAVQTLEIV